jgi:hypothetical protein
LKKGGLTAITLDYTEAIANPHATARRVHPFLGSALDEDAMAAVIDCSLYRGTPALVVMLGPSSPATSTAAPSPRIPGTTASIMLLVTADMLTCASL